MSRVLLVEDDASLGRTLAERLSLEGLTVRWVQSVADAQQQLGTGAWDLAILDVKLPDGSGFGLARQIRRSMTTPIMFMTALNSAENRLEGFDIGADEYLPKPFHLREFLIRVRRLLARFKAPRTIHAGGLVIDLDAMSVEAADGRKTYLQVRDARVLSLLVNAAPHPVDRSQILDRAWGEDQYPTPRAVDNAIVRLRQAMHDADGRLIRSVRGVGYQWAGSETT